MRLNPVSEEQDIVILFISKVFMIKEWADCTACGVKDGWEHPSD